MGFREELKELADYLHAADALGNATGELIFAVMNEPGYSDFLARMTEIADRLKPAMETFRVKEPTDLLLIRSSRERKGDEKINVYELEGYRLDPRYLYAYEIVKFWAHTSPVKPLYIWRMKDQNTKGDLIVIIEHVFDFALNCRVLREIIRPELYEPYLMQCRLMFGGVI